MPDVETIGVEAFGDCSSLKEINLPKVIKVSDYAFASLIKNFHYQK